MFFAPASRLFRDRQKMLAEGGSRHAKRMAGLQALRASPCPAVANNCSILRISGP